LAAAANLSRSIEKSFVLGPALGPASTVGEITGNGFQASKPSDPGPSGGAGTKTWPPSSDGRGSAARFTVQAVNARTDAKNEAKPNEREPGE